MRLINTANLSIEEFTGERIPLYAILSHTWGAEEISFQDMQSLMAVKQLKLGYSKIRHCCEIAAKDGFKYLWADTCCIDKTSSSELSEAINSMYRWYASAKVCFVYLADVASSEDPYKSDSGFRRSRWFTRGWTLQELLAPPDLLFYSSDWKEIGSKASLTDLISHITGIPDRILWTGDVKSASIAQRMSWASMRKTTRLEDTAYCLMGLFGVHMPMLYGEGNGAFIRLQEEIMKRTDDQTIFAWRIEYGSHNKVLASHPAAFKLSGSMIPTNRVISHRPLSVTSKGIHIELRVKPLRGAHQDGKFLALLACQDMKQPDAVVGILLQEQGYDTGQFTRIEASKLGIVYNSDEELDQYILREMYLEQSTSDQSYLGLGLNNRYFIKTNSELKTHGISLVSTIGRQRCYLTDRGISCRESTGYYELVVSEGHFRFRECNYNSQSQIPDDTIVAAIQFEEFVGNRFVVLIRRRFLHSYIQIEPLPKSETLQSLIYSFRIVPTDPILGITRRVWKNYSHRQIWRLLGRDKSVSVVIRKQVIEEKIKDIIYVSVV